MFTSLSERIVCMSPTETRKALADYNEAKYQRGFEFVLDRSFWDDFETLANDYNRDLRQMKSELKKQVLIKMRKAFSLERRYQLEKMKLEPHQVKLDRINREIAEKLQTAGISPYRASEARTIASASEEIFEGFVRGELGWKEALRLARNEKKKVKRDDPARD